MLVWLLVIGIALYIEFITVQLVGLQFAIGGIFGLMAYLLGLDLMYQLIIFIIVSIISLWIMQKWFRKKIVPKHTETNIGLLIGKTVEITELDNTLKKGVGKVNGVNWTIISEENLDVNSKAKITKIIGTTLLVRKGE